MRTYTSKLPSSSQAAPKTEPTAFPAQLWDNRPEALAQQSLQDQINASDRVRQTGIYQRAQQERPMAQTWANDQSMLTQAPSPSLPSASPMQLLRSKASFEQMMGANADAFAHIATKLEQYAALPANNRTGKQNILANIETKIYQWLAANHDSKDEKAMHVLMNDVQAEHVAVIRAVEANNETPQWMSDEAQPADYAQLWADLVAGRGSQT